MGKYFGTDGIRGKANVDLTADRAFQVGRYLGYYFSRTGKQRILIGKDTRISSDMLEHALAAGIAAQGCDVFLAGVCPTPMISYLTRTENFACGVMISASHNPYYDNGIKVFSKEGIKLPEEIENQIESYIDGETELFYQSGSEIGSIEVYEQGLEHYLDHVAEILPVNLNGLRLLVDCANGSSSVSAQRLLTRLGAECVMMNHNPDGININRSCGSTHPEELCRRMTEGNYDLGLAFDGDADRMILCAADGSLLTGDHMLYLIGKYLDRQNMLKDHMVVTTVMANLGLFKALEQAHIQLCCTQVGDKYVYQEMVKGDYSVGGEQSGHIIFKEYETTGDGLVTALMVLKVMTETGQTAEELKRGLTIYPQLLVNVKVSDKNEALRDMDVLAAIEEVNSRLSGNGRLLVRPSGTEPLVRVMAEAETAEICEAEVEKIAAIVRRKYGIS